MTFKQRIVLNICFLCEAVTLKNATCIRTYENLRSSIIEVTIRSDKITWHTIHRSPFYSTLLHHQARRRTGFHKYSILTSGYFTSVKLNRSVGRRYNDTIFTILHLYASKHNAGGRTTINMNTSLAVFQMKAVIMTVRIAVTGHAISGLKTTIISFDIDETGVRPVITTHCYTYPILIDPICESGTCFRCPFKPWTCPIIRRKVYLLKTTDVSYFINLNTTAQWGSIYIIDIRATATVLSRKDNAAIRIYQCYMTDITIFITPHTITAIKHCRRIGLYMIRILMWVPNGKIGQGSGRLHGDERFRLKFISPGIVYHQNGSLYGYSFGRPFPFATQRHTCRNIKFPGNTVTAGRSKKHTATPVLT